MSPTLDDLVSDFQLLDDWEDRYRYVIELGKELPPLAPELHTAATKVSGCASQVWIHANRMESPEGPRLQLEGDSDALIVKGLVAIAFKIYGGQLLKDVAVTDAASVFAQLGLKDHLTPQRANGLASMVARIRTEAASLLNR